MLAAASLPAGCSHIPRDGYHEIIVSSGRRVVARQVEGEWWCWDNVDAMNETRADLGLRPGEHRVEFSAPRLGILIDAMDMSERTNKNTES